MRNVNVGDLISKIEKHAENPYDLENSEIRQIEYLIHILLGWQEIRADAECSMYTPGARWSPGSDCYYIDTAYFIPPDVIERFRLAMEDELLEGEVPPVYDQDNAEDWWLGDDREEQYPVPYLSQMSSTIKMVPQGWELRISMDPIKMELVHVETGRTVSNDSRDHLLAVALCCLYARLDG